MLARYKSLCFLFQYYIIHVVSLCLCIITICMHF